MKVTDFKFDLDNTEPCPFCGVNDGVAMVDAEEGQFRFRVICRNHNEPVIGPPAPTPDKAAELWDMRDTLHMGINDPKAGA